MRIFFERRVEVHRECFRILLTRMCSMHLLIIQVRETGLELQGLCLSPFLKIGPIFASFQSFGTWPVCSDLLNASIGEIWWLNSFRTVGGIVSGSAALWGFMLDRICWIPVAEMLIAGMDEQGLGPMLGRGPGCSCVYMDEKCSGSFACDIAMHNTLVSEWGYA